MKVPMTNRWHHGSLGWDCCGGPVPVSSLSDERMRETVQHGVHKGKTGVFARCPKCEAEGRTCWMRIGVEGGEG